MPTGHTDKTTVNRRRKMTPWMAEILATITRRSIPGLRLQWRDLSTGEKNAVRALADRGYIRSNYFEPLEPTREGIAALKAISPP